MNDDCIFCKIIAGTIPATFAHQDDEVVAIQDVHPQAPTHVLIIPRRHIPTVLDLRAEDASLLGRIYEVANQIARERKLQDGFRVVVNNGPGGGQTVYHLHFHLLGGRPMQWPPG
jgi:histidine triad (HIT) family protein